MTITEIQKILENRSSDAANMVSIIVPVFNEAGNVTELIKRIDKSMQSSHMRYEVIIIDDHSNDGTKEKILPLVQEYPVRYFQKKGIRGKAQSILEGFTYINKNGSHQKLGFQTDLRGGSSNIVAIIDGDLQYSPETIPQMVKTIEKGADVVIAKREYEEVGLIRRISSNLFAYVFGLFLHGFPYDIQSGLKVFKTTVLDQINMNPRSGWMFDLEFLLQARKIGCKIEEVPMAFQKRVYGESKIHILNSSFEMAVEAIRLKIHDTSFLAFNKKTEKQLGNGFYYQGRKYIHHSDLNLQETAFKRFSSKQIFQLCVAVLMMGVLLYINHHVTMVAIIGIITLLYFIDLIFVFYLVYMAVTTDPSIRATRKQLQKIQDADLPVYTILCPLYKESNVIRQFVSSIRALDYPQEKLQVLILLEADDIESIETTKQLYLPSYIRVLVIPDSRPKTKPKALNYGLQFATGEYLVIYDAEDIPEPTQLKKAWLAFQESEPNVVCIQAKLQYFNPEHNMLTRLFSIEYLLLFDLILPGLQAINAPMPLGGTSNHFKTDILKKKLHGWDSFNVTEDADLGIRLYRYGYKTQIIESITLEEANSNLANWIKQRTRWIKGYIQTYFVHLRDGKGIAYDITNPHSLTFHLLMGWKTLFLFINPFLWLVTLTYFIFRPQIGSFIESFFPPYVFYMGILVLITGNFLYFYMYLIALGKRSKWHMVNYTFLMPVYWLFMSYAGFLAFIEFIVKPHYWNKTIHGLYERKTQEELIVTKLIPAVRTIPSGIQHRQNI